MATGRVKHSGIESSVDASGKRSYSVIWVVDGAEDEGPLAIEAATPALGSAFDYNGTTDNTVALFKKSPRWIEKGVWEVTCEYSDRGKDPRNNENPLLRPAIRRWGSVVSEVYPFRDVNGKPFVNSAGARFDPALGVPTHYSVLTIQRNEAFFLASTMRNYVNRTNADTFYGYAPGQAKMARIEAEEDLFQNNYTYCKVTYEIYLTDAAWGWEEPVLDAGTYWVERDASGEIKQAHRKLPWETVETTDIKMLDGKGRYLPKSRLDKLDLEFLTFQRHRTAIFGNLSLEW